MGGVRGTLLFILFISLLCYATNNIPTTSALEATFTPNPEDSSGPLPVSMAQRKQLLELETAIINSQDPSATLSHVAQQNNMSSEELAGMLERNHNDLQNSGQLEGLMGVVNASLQQQAAGGTRSMSSSLPRRIISLLTSIILTLFKTASIQISRNPKSSTLFFLLLTCTLLGIHNAPKNGIVISSPMNPFTKGHSTLLEPPVSYLERYVLSSYERNDGWISSLPEPTKTSKSKKKKQQQVVGGVGMTNLLDFDMSNLQEGEVTVSTSRGSKVQDGFSLITTAQTLVSVDVNKDEGSELHEEETECMHDSIRSIMEERKFTEFISSGNDDSHSLLKFRSFLVASDEDDDLSEGAIMAMKLLGDFGRYGIQPMCISYETDTDDDENDDDSVPMTHCVAFHTLTGGHFDGELQFLVEEAKSGSVAISVTLAIPKGGRAPPTRLAELMVSSLTESLSQSLRIRTKQTLARRGQSKRYRDVAIGRASTKRHLRYEQEKAQEEMAAERKRKWKRNAGVEGTYRPTGCRGPQGSPKFGF